MRRVVAAALILGFASTAAAQPESAYYGLQIGSFDYQEAESQGFSAISDTTDSYRLMVGYQFVDHLTVEGSYGVTGTVRDTTTVSDPFFPAPFTIDFATEFEILTIKLLGVVNFDSGVTLLGGIGYADMKQDIDLVIGLPGFAPVSVDQDIGEMTFFAGVQYDWDRIALRLGYEKYDMSDGVDIDEASLAFLYKL